MLYKSRHSRLTKGVSCTSVDTVEVLPNLVYTEFVKLKKYGSLKNSYSQVSKFTLRETVSV